MVTPPVLAALMTDLNCSWTALVTEKPSEKKNNVLRAARTPFWPLMIASSAATERQP